MMQLITSLLRYFVNSLLNWLATANKPVTPVESDIVLLKADICWHPRDATVMNDWLTRLTSQAAAPSLCAANQAFTASRLGR